MDSPAQVLLIERFKSVIPSCAQPFISDIKDLSPNRNCGFRAITEGLGVHPKYWGEVMRGLMNEMDTNEAWWRAMFNREDPHLYDTVGSKLDWFNTVRPAPETRWFYVPPPPHGYLVAQAYGCVLVNIHGNDTEAYFPLRLGLDMISNPPVICIANWGGNHWINIKLEGDFPMSSPDCNWERKPQREALEWKTHSEQRLSEFKHISQA
ncbi:uncharacterized protein LOC143624295 [Bidens hawaiensis]|uniref:uncharacterized protein LOC143624295 n=1 Tax=Bidens hawaiensis TaxID=980011 RepID=UPI004049C10B